MTDNPTSNDGRSRWWLRLWPIPSAIAGVLGVAGATILRQRRQHASPPASETQPDLAVPPLSPIAAIDPEPAGRDDRLTPDR